MKEHITIGVAGHVDHGKTSFVRHITGINTDRHPEEKRRGLSLEAGIACWPRPNGTVASFVDVPGHRDFLRNTVRGLHGVDIGILVVAADDGVMVQTREHLDILSFFQLKDGIVVISKADCVDAEVIELAELEVMELIEGTFLEGKPIIRFSTVTGQGYDEVIETLDAVLVKRSKENHEEKPFRLWIDQVRAFTGIGTVVSGTVSSGTIRVNDELLLLPGGSTTRVRSLESHANKVDRAAAGQRAGLNLTGLEPGTVKRGMSLVRQGSFPAAGRFNVLLQITRHSQEVINDKQKVKFFIGTSVLNVTIIYIYSLQSETEKGELVQIQTAENIPVVPGDSFVISPMNRNTIIAGGMVLELNDEKVRPANRERTAARLQALLANDPQSYIIHLSQHRSGFPIDPELLITRSLLDRVTLSEYLAQALDNGELIRFADQRILRRVHYDYYKKMFSDIITASFAEKPDRGPMQLGEIIHQCRPGCDMVMASLVMEKLLGDPMWKKENGGIRPASRERRLPDELAPLASALRAYSRQQGIRPFSADYFVESTAGNFTLSQVRKSLDFFCACNEMVRLRNDRYLADAAIEEIKKKVTKWIEQKGEFLLKDCKDALDFNRGLGLHVLEYLDQIGFTIKQGDGRKIAAEVVI